jgi:hypothetical protein
VSTKRERKSKWGESVTEGLCPGGSTKRERGKVKGGESVIEGLCVEEQPLLFFFSSPSVISTSSRGSEGGELGRRSRSLRSSLLAP